MNLLMIQRNSSNNKNFRTSTDNNAAIDSIILKGATQEQSDLKVKAASSSVSNISSTTKNMLGSSSKSNITTTGSVSSKTTAAWIAALQRLETQCPSSTAEERERFLRARNGDAKQACHQLKKYLKWHYKYNPEDHDATTNNQDRNSYTTSSTTESASSTHSSLGTIEDTKEDGEMNEPGISQSSTDKSEEDMIMELETKLVYMPDDDDNYHGDDIDKKDNNESGINSTKNLAVVNARARDGSRMFHIIPAMLESEHSTKHQVNQVARYIDLKLSRTSMEKVFVVIDVRKGSDKCPNPPPMKCLPFAKQCCSLLPDLFPERLLTCVVYPVPTMFQWLWNTILQPLLDKDVAEKFRLLSDNNTNWNDPPPNGIKEFFDDSAISTMENYRKTIFETC